MSDAESYLMSYPGGFHIVLIRLGPLEWLTVLAMIAVVLIAAWRSFPAMGNTLLAALPLALGMGCALWKARALVPYIDKAVQKIPVPDLDTRILSAVAEIRVFLILGLLFSFLAVLAILLRHRRKATAP